MLPGPPLNNFFFFPTSTFPYRPVYVVGEKWRRVHAGTIQAKQPPRQKHGAGDTTLVVAVKQDGQPNTGNGK